MNHNRPATRPHRYDRQLYGCNKIFPSRPIFISYKFLFFFIFLLFSPSESRGGALRIRRRKGRGYVYTYVCRGGSGPVPPGGYDKQSDNDRGARGSEDFSLEHSHSAGARALLSSLPGERLAERREENLAAKLNPRDVEYRDGTAAAATQRRAPRAFGGPLEKGASKSLRGSW